MLLTQVFPRTKVQTIFKIWCTFNTNIHVIVYDIVYEVFSLPLQNIPIKTLVFGIISVILQQTSRDHESKRD